MNAITKPEPAAPADWIDRLPGPVSVQQSHGRVILSWFPGMAGGVTASQSYTPAEAKAIGEALIRAAGEVG